MEPAVHEPLKWSVDGMHWPNREASRFVQAAGLRWHVQQFGRGGQPLVLLIHGTGASAHSWRDVALALASSFEVLALDLPGHGFTAMPDKGSASPQFLLPGMADALGELLQVLGAEPQVIAGHSSGAALAATLCLRGRAQPSALLSFNGAFFPLGGWSGRLLSPVAKVIAQSPWVPRLFAAQASQATVLNRLIDGTGSRLDTTGTALYHQLVSNPSHAAGALGMMANWDLHGLPAAMAALPMPLHLVVGSNDRTVAPAQAHRLQRLLASSVDMTVTSLEGLGHLAHEEQPQRAAQLIELRFLDATKRSHPA